MYSIYIYILYKYILYTLQGTSAISHQNGKFAAKSSTQKSARAGRGYMFFFPSRVYLYFVCFPWVKTPSPQEPECLSHRWGFWAPLPSPASLSRHGCAVAALPGKVGT